MRILRHSAFILASIAFSLTAAPYAEATPWLSFPTGLSGWTTQGTVTTSNSTVSLNLNGTPFSLTPPTGQNMVEVNPQGAAAGTVDSLLGLSANSIETLLNNSNGHVTNFGFLTDTLALNPGTYSFSWAYAAQDYQPFNDGVLFALSGNGAQSITSLARNGSSPTDTSGPQPGTLILGSYGSTAWENTSFTISTAANYQVSFAAYNWNDTALNPLLFVAPAAGSYTGTPVKTSGGTPPPVTTIGTSGGDISASVFDTSSTAYAQSALTFDGGTLQYGASGTTTKNATLNSTGGAIDTGSYTVSYSGVISGSGALTKTGSGTLALSAANTYTGGTDISSGTLSLTGNGSLASSSGIADNGSFDISGANQGESIQTLSGTGGVALGANTLTLLNANGTFSGAIAGSGGLSVSSGTEVLSGVNTYSGATQIGSSGTLTLNGNGCLCGSDYVENNGLLDLSATNATNLASIAGNGVINLGASQLSLTNALTTFSGTLKGTGSLLVKSGIQTLSGNNTFSGGTTIDNGATLLVSTASALGDGNVVLNGGALQYESVSTGPATTDYAGKISGNGSLLKTGSGALELSSTNTYTGTTGIYSGTLSLAGSGAIANSGVVDNGSFDISGANHGESIQTLSGTGGVSLGANTLTLLNANGTFSGAIAGSGGLSISSGTEVLSGANTYTGLTQVGNGGSLSLEGTGCLCQSKGIVDDGLLSVFTNNTQALTTLSGTGSVDLKAGPLALTAAAGNFSGTVEGSGAFWLNGGTETLSGVNTFSGGTAVSSGATLIAANSAALGTGAIALNGGTLEDTVSQSLSQAVTVSAGANLNTQSGTTTTISGPMSTSGPGSCFIKSGAGTLALSGNATLSNGTCVTQGQLQANGLLTSVVSVSQGAMLRGIGEISGPVTVQGTLAPGHSPGTLTVNGTVTMANGSTYQEDINGLGLGTGPGNYSRLLIIGKNSQFIASGATLMPNLTAITGMGTYVPYVPSLGDTFVVVTAQGGIVGRFASLAQPNGLASNTQFAAFYNENGNNSIDLRVVPLSYAAYFSSFAADGNTQAVGTALDALATENNKGAASASQSALYFDLAGLNAKELATVAPALNGEVHGDLAAVAPLEGEWLSGTVMRELSTPEASARTLRHAPGNALWFYTGANHGHWHAGNGSSGFYSNSVNTAAGLDLFSTATARAGVGFSHSLTTVGTLSGGGSVEQNLLFAYGEKSLKGVIVEGLAGYGTSIWGTLRADPLGLTPALTTRVNGRTALVSLGVSVPKRLRALTLTPYARVLWQKVSRNAFNEAAYAPAAVDAVSGPGYSAKGLRVMLGLSLGSANQNPLASFLTYQANLALAHDSSAFTDPTTFATLGGERFSIATPDIGREAVIARLSATMRLAPKLFTYLAVSSEARTGTSANYGGELGLRALF